MPNLNEAWVEKAREVVGRLLAPDEPQATDDALARAVLAAVLPDVRRAVAEELEAEAHRLSDVHDAYDQGLVEGLRLGSRIAREVEGLAREVVEGPNA